MSSGRPRNFDRDAALQTATKLFCKYGYEGVSISDLTRALGIGPTSLYAALDQKEMLYREAVELCLTRADVMDPKQNGLMRAQILALRCNAVKAATAPEYPGGMVAIGMLSCSS